MHVWGSSSKTASSWSWDFVTSFIHWKDRNQLILLVVISIAVWIYELQLFATVFLIVCPNFQQKYKRKCLWETRGGTWAMFMYYLMNLRNIPVLWVKFGAVAVFMYCNWQKKLQQVFLIPIYFEPMHLSTGSAPPLSFLVPSQFQYSMN